MKQYKYIPLALCLSALSANIFSSCISDDEELQEVQIDTKMIVGSWVDALHPSEHWRYEPMNSNGTGTGVFWDTADDMTYDDAAKGPGLFQYHFNETGLMRIFWMEMNNSYSSPDTDAPYIIDVLNATTMTYHSQGNSRNSHTFNRQ